MKYEHYDKVKIMSGKFKDAQGAVVGRSITHRNNVPSEPEYKVQLLELKVVEEFAESNLLLVEKYVEPTGITPLEEKRAQLEAKRKELEREVKILQEEDLIKKLEEQKKQLLEKNNG